MPVPRARSRVRSVNFGTVPLVPRQETRAGTLITTKCRNSPLAPSAPPATAEFPASAPQSRRGQQSRGLSGSFAWRRH